MQHLRKSFFQPTCTNMSVILTEMPSYRSGWKQQVAVHHALAGAGDETVSNAALSDTGTRKEKHGGEQQVTTDLGVVCHLRPWKLRKLLQPLP